MILKLKIFIYNLICVKIKYYFLFYIKNLTREQILNPKKIPVIIVNYNQLTRSAL